MLNFVKRVVLTSIQRFKELKKRPSKVLIALPGSKKTVKDADTSGPELLLTRDDRDRYESLTGKSLHECPVRLSLGRMLIVKQITRPAPPPIIIDIS